MNKILIGIIVITCLNYAIFVGWFLISLQPSKFTSLIVIFHLIFGMLSWATVNYIRSSPGQVSVHWGRFAP